MESRPVVDEYGVDYTRPLWPQLAALGDRYWEWSHTPLTPKFSRQLAAARPHARHPASFPIFANPWLERQTHIRWQHVVALWAPIAVALAVLGAGRLAAPLVVGVGWWLVGMAVWTLVEYLLHRVLFHHRPRTPWQRRAHFLAHGIHHKDPHDRTRLVFPLLAAAGIATAIFAILVSLLPLAPSLLVMSGLLVGYLGYDLGHYAWHHASFDRGVLRTLKRHHLAHHYQDMDSRFGVSVPLWDWVFGSFPRQS